MSLYGPDNSPLPEHAPQGRRLSHLMARIWALVPKGWKFLVGSGGLITILAVVVTCLPHRDTSTPKPDDVSLREETRSLLESINRGILPRVDAGEQQILVMMSQPHVVRLLTISQKPGFDKYLGFRETGAVIMASRNVQVGNYLNDQDGSPNLSGYAIMPKDALRK